MVFLDRQTLISRNTADRELEQAVRFLHDNGTLLHYEDPLLKDFYFVDPQWLCDMLAHIVTVREINPLVKDGAHACVCVCMCESMCVVCDTVCEYVIEGNIPPPLLTGIMRTADFPLIFNDIEFPIRWKREYIRLLTTFEVAVELNEGELLIPSMLPTEKPNLPQTMFPEELVRLARLHVSHMILLLH